MALLGPVVPSSPCFLAPPTREACPWTPFPSPGFCHPFTQQAAWRAEGHLPDCLLPPECVLCWEVGRQRKGPQTDPPVINAPLATDLSGWRWGWLVSGDGAHPGLWQVVCSWLEDPSEGPLWPVHFKAQCALRMEWVGWRRALRQVIHA